MRDGKQAAVAIHEYIQSKVQDEGNKAIVSTGAEVVGT
jgi:hypothetical protein